MSLSKEKKDADSGERGAQRQKRSKDKLIRLDDLIPDEKVVGGQQIFRRDWHNPKPKKQLKKSNMSEEKKDKPQVDVRDLKPTKDAKGGGTHKGVQGVRKSHDVA